MGISSARRRQSYRRACQFGPPDNVTLPWPAGRSPRVAEMRSQHGSSHLTLGRGLSPAEGRYLSLFFVRIRCSHSAAGFHPRKDGAASPPRSSIGGFSLGRGFFARGRPEADLPAAASLRVFIHPPAFAGGIWHALYEVRHSNLSTIRPRAGARGRGCRRGSGSSAFPVGRMRAVRPHIGHAPFLPVVCRSRSCGREPIMCPLIRRRPGPAARRPACPQRLRRICFWMTSCNRYIRPATATARNESNNIERGTHATG